eukprot:Sdes_comp20430_c1_seq4m14572
MIEKFKFKFKFQILQNSFKFFQFLSISSNPPTQSSTIFLSFAKPSPQNLLMHKDDNEPVPDTPNHRPSQLPESLSHREPSHRGHETRRGPENRHRGLLDALSYQEHWSAWE